MTISPRCQRQKQRQRMKNTQHVLYFRKAEDSRISNMTISPRCQRQRQRQRHRQIMKKTQHVLYFWEAEDASIVAKDVKISTDQFPPRKKLAPKKRRYTYQLSVLWCYGAQFFACFSQKLAPAKKNSTNRLARLARFCNSALRCHIWQSWLFENFSLSDQVIVYFVRGMFCIMITIQFLNCVSTQKFQNLIVTYPQKTNNRPSLL